MLEILMQVNIQSLDKVPNVTKLLNKALLNVMVEGRKLYLWAK